MRPNVTHGHQQVKQPRSMKRRQLYIVRFFHISFQNKKDISNACIYDIWLYLQLLRSSQQSHRPVDQGAGEWGWATGMIGMPVVVRGWTSKLQGSGGADDGGIWGFGANADGAKGSDSFCNSAMPMLEYMRISDIQICVVAKMLKTWSHRTFTFNQYVCRWFRYSGLLARYVPFDN